MGRSQPFWLTGRAACIKSNTAIGQTGKKNLRCAIQEADTVRDPSATPPAPAHHAQLLQHSAPCTSARLGFEPIRDHGGTCALQCEHICAHLIATLLRVGETQCGALCPWCACALAQAVWPRAKGWTRGLTPPHLPVPLEGPLFGETCSQPLWARHVKSWRQINALDSGA